MIISKFNILIVNSDILVMWFLYIKLMIVIYSLMIVTFITTKMIIFIQFNDFSLNCFTSY